MSVAIQWMWVYGTLQAEAFDTLDEAIRDSISAEDWGNGTLHLIEHEGVCIKSSHPKYREVEDAIEAKERAEREARPKPTHSLWVKAPETTKWGLVDSGSREDIDLLARNWADLLGDKNRVAVRVIKR